MKDSCTIMITKTPNGALDDLNVNYGRTEYQFVINHNPNDSTYLTPDGIFINDSVKIIASHNMVGHDFPDRETFLNRHNKNLH